MTVAPQESAPLNDYARRIALLQDAGHSWMSPTTQATLAHPSTGSDQQMLDAAGALHSVANDSSFPHPVVYADPQATRQSNILRASVYVSHIAGSLPINEADLTYTQRRLQAAGYGKGLPVSGVWTSDWQDAAYQAHSDALAAQNHGEGQPLTTTANKAAHSFFSAFLPSHAIPALWGWVKSVSGQVNSLGQELMGDVAATAYDFAHPTGFIPGTEQYHQAGKFGASAVATVDNLFGGHQTAQQVRATEAKRFTDSLGLAFTVAPAMKVGSAVYDAAGGAIRRGLFTDLGAAAAQRGPGTVVNTLYRTADGRPAGLLSTRLFAATPGLKHIGPIFGKVMDADGVYYRSRSFAALPYRLPIVSAAGSIGQHAITLGATVRGAAGLESAAGQRDATLAQSVYRQHALSGPWASALDLLSAGLHGPLPGKPAIGVNPSHTVSDLVEGAGDNANAALGPAGIVYAFEKGTGLNYGKLVQQYGKAEVDNFLNEKIDRFAAWHAARAQTGGTFDKAEEFRQIAHSTLNDAPSLDAARRDFLGMTSEQVVAWRRDANEIRGDIRRAYANGLDSYMPARTIARDINANHRGELITPLSFGAVSDARTEAQIAGTAPVRPRTAQEALQQAYNRPNVEAPQPSLTAEWLSTHQPQGERGSLGIARLDTPTKQVGKTQASKFLARLRAAGLSDAATAEADKQGIILPRQPGEPFTPPSTASERLLGKKPREFNRGPQVPPESPTLDPAEIAAVRKEAYHYLLEHGSLDPRSLGALDAVQMAGKVAEESKKWASEVYLPPDASEALRAKVAALNDKGYRLVFGTDIGHGFEPSPLLDPLIIEGHETWRRKVATALGLNNIPVPTSVQGALHQTEWQDLLNAAIDDGKIRAPFGYNGERLLNHAYANLQSKVSLPPLDRAAFAISKRAFRAQAEALAGPNATAEELQQAYDRIERGIAKGISFRDVKQKDFVKALMTPPPEIVNEMRDAGLDVPLVTKADAQRIYRLGIAAAGRRPMWAMGLSKAEDVFRSGFGFTGSAAADVPILNRVAVMPNALLRFRDRYRFQLDPTFSARRVAKTVLKMMAEGVPGTVTPFASMEKAGTTQEDMGLLDRLMPNVRNGMGDGFDAMDRALLQSDVFGLYNPAHYMAYAAGWWKRAGLDDAEVKRLLVKTFTYGDRPAWERTVGTIFYPFSFDRTLYRNLGFYLLDHPAQRYQLTAALQAYDALSKHNDIGGWLTAHAPVLKEVNKLNAFTHGVGPGELGGINAPYASALWGVFGPHRVDKPTPTAIQTIQTALPVLRNLNSMLIGADKNGQIHGGTAVEQGVISFWGAVNAVDDVTRWLRNDPRSPLNPQHPAMTRLAQQDAAWRLRNAMLVKFAPVVTYNNGRRDGKVTWGKDAPANLAGQPIDRTTISTLVHAYYPAWDPNAPSQEARAKQTRIDSYLANLRATDPVRGQVYTEFNKHFDQFKTYKINHELDPSSWAKLAAASTAFRRVATNLAEQDPRFVHFYNAFYDSQLGPLEELTR